MLYDPLERTYIDTGFIYIFFFMGVPPIFIYLYGFFLQITCNIEAEAPINVHSNMNSMMEENINDNSIQNVLTSKEGKDFTYIME